MKLSGRLKIKEIKAKSIITKSGLPGVDFVINPYTGCMHGCKYCYARFIKKFTGHKEPWGCFVDVKINAPDLITDKQKGKHILIGSVTDAYQPIERKYELTRKILKKLILIQPDLEIITKSDLIVRDIDLLKQFKNLTVAISIAFNEKDRKELDVLASPIEKRINALKKLHKAGIKTIVFISPIFPEITDWKKIIEKTKSYANMFWFENLNLYFSIQDNIFKFLKKNYPELVDKYKKIYSNKDYWEKEEKNIRDYCRKNNIKFRIFFHHKKS
ncbi:radical SAM protein [Patescibacteria group bacterium]|nr:radical SAM protein [Patescibacteria group bacterium]